MPVLRQKKKLRERKGKKSLILITERMREFKACSSEGKKLDFHSWFFWLCHNRQAPQTVSSPKWR